MSSNHERQQSSIRKIPLDVYSTDRHFYHPQMIFTGPYSYDTQNKHKIEQRRRDCENRIRSRSSELYETYKEALRPILGELRGMYDHLDDPWTSDDMFLGMMVADGWYLLLIMSATIYQGGGVDDTLGYNDDDRPCLFNPNYIQAYKCDMLIYHNQIPLKVLEQIISIQKHYWDKSVIYRFLVNLILRFYTQCELYSPLPLLQYFESGPKSLHILDVYRNALLMGSKSYDSGSSNGRGGEDKPRTYKVTTPSATKLKGARIKIRTSKSPCSTDISFDEKKLFLPQLSVHVDTTELIFHNLIWFERFNPCVGMHISSYLYFMSNLVQEAADSNLLRDRGAINTMLHDDKVAELFKGLCKNMKFNPNQSMDHELLKVGEDVKERYDKNSEEWRKDLFQNYLRSPWAYIPIVYAILILALSVLQTVYTMMGYYRGK